MNFTCGMQKGFLNSSFMKNLILIFTLFTTLGVSAQSKQDSVKLKSNAELTKATFSEKVKGNIVKYKTVYLDRSTKRLFVIAINEKTGRYYKKVLPKNIDID